MSRLTLFIIHKQKIRHTHKLVDIVKNEFIIKQLSNYK